MQRLLLFREDHLGDLVLTTPLIRSLAENGYVVDVLVRKSNADILINNPYIKEVFFLEDIVKSFPAEWTKVVSWLRARKYDVLVIPHAKPKQMVYVSTLSGVKTRILMHAGLIGRITGNTCLRSKLYTKPRHMSDVWLDIARHLGISPAVPKPEIFLTEREIEWGKSMLVEKFGMKSKIIGIHPGSAGNTCNLPFEEYGDFARKILDETDYKIVITGSTRERSLISAWPNEVIDSERVWISAGELDLRELSSVIRQLFLYVCSGTGPLHIANAVGGSTFSTFCSRIGHNNNYWGNTNGNGKYINIRTASCATQISNCQFRGACDAQVLFKGLMTVIKQPV